MIYKIKNLIKYGDSRRPLPCPPPHPEMSDFFSCLYLVRNLYEFVRLLFSVNKLRINSKNGRINSYKLHTYYSQNKFL
jgi:hypothetical protein